MYDTKLVESLLSTTLGMRSDLLGQVWQWIKVSRLCKKGQYRIALIIHGSLILRIWNHSRNYFSENFDTFNNGGNGKRITRIGRLSSAQKFFTDWCIPDLLINMITMDHGFNLEGRHCFSISHQLQLVDERAKSARYYRYHVYAPARNSLIVGVAHWAARIRVIISTKF